MLKLLNKIVLLKGNITHHECCLSVIFQANLPKPLWYFGIQHSIHLINRTFSPLLNNQTPYELFYGYSITFLLLKVFGCLCYTYTFSSVIFYMIFILIKHSFIEMWSFMNIISLFILIIMLLPQLVLLFMTLHQIFWTFPHCPIWNLSQLIVTF